MNQLALQVLIVVAFGTFCFGCGYLTAFIVTRNQWRGDMISAVLPTTTSGPASGNGESKQVGATSPAGDRQPRCSQKMKPTLTLLAAFR